MGTIKERNSKDLIEAEEIKKGWNPSVTQENCTKRILMTRITTMVLSHSEPDTLECEVKWL